MAVIRSPFSRDNTPRQGGQGDSLLDQIRRQAESGQPSAVPTPPVSAGGAVPRLTPVAPSGPRPTGRDDMRQLTARELEQIARSEISELRGATTAATAARAGQQIRDIAAGGEEPSRGVGQLFGTIGRGAMKVLETALLPQRAVQAGIASIGEGLKVVGQPLAQEIQSAAAGARAGVPVRVSTAGRAPTESVERLVQPVSDERGVLEVGTGRRPSGRSYGQLVSDPSFFLTIPNIRDNVKIPRTGIGLIDNFVKAGVYTLDASIELGFQGVTDPTAWVTFGAGQFAGQGGRAALAGRLLQKDAVEVAPTLLNNPERLYRLGEWGLTRGERAALAAADILPPAGLSWNFGERATIGAGSELGQAISGGLARGVGAPISRVRAAVGDIPVMSRISELTTPTSRRQLTGVARGKVTGADARRSIANYAAQQNARGVYGRVSQVLASRHAPLIAEVASSPFRNDIARIVESEITGGVLPTGGAVDPLALDLAQRVSAAFADMRQTYNDSLMDFMRRYDLDPQNVAQIADIENYFYHTLTPEAQRWVASEGRGMSADLVPQVTQTLNIGPNEMKVGGGPIRGRKLKAGEEWLGSPLQTGSIDEINQRWREVMAPNLKRGQEAFDWFETDTAAVLTSYIDSIARQSKRIAYADKLFDYGDEFILPLMNKVVPDKKLVAAATAAVNELKKERAAVVRRLTGVAYTGGTPREGARVLSGVRRLAQKIVDDGIQSVDDAEEAMLQALTRLRDQEQKLADAVQAARAQGSNISTAYEAMIAPIRARIVTLQKAIEGGQGARELARQELLDEHTRMFPRRAKRPQDVETLAAEISGAKQKRLGQKLAALETRSGRAEAARQKAEAGVSRVRGQIEGIQQRSEDFTARVNRLKAVEEASSNSDPEFFPDGLIYTTVEHLEGNAAEGRASYWFGTSDLDVPEGEQLVALPAPSKGGTFDMSKDLDDAREIIMLLPASFSLSELGEDVWGPQAAGWAEWMSNETERLIAAPRGTEIDPRVPDELKPLIAAIVGWGWQDEASPETFRLYAAEILDALNGMQAAVGREIDPEFSEEIFHSALTGAADLSERAVGSRISAVIVPSIEWEDDYSVLVTSRWALRIVDNDPEIGQIVEGTQAWDDVVPPPRAAVEPTAAAAPVEPTAAAPVAAPAVSAEGVTLEQAREVIGGGWPWATRSDRIPVLNQLVDDAKKLQGRVRNGTIAADKADEQFAALIDQLDQVATVEDKAHLLGAAYNTPSAQRNAFLDAVEDRFGIEVEFAIGNAAAGNGTDNFSRGVQQKARANPEVFQPFIADAARSASVKKPAAYAKLSKADKDRLVAASTSVEPVVPAAPAAFTEPAGPEPVNRLIQLLELETGPEAERVRAGLAKVPELEERAAGFERQAGEAAERVAAVARQERAARGAATRAQRVLGERVERATSQMVDVEGERITERQAAGRLRSEERKLLAKEKELQRAMDSDPVLKQVPKEQRTVDKLATIFETSKATVAGREEWQQNVLPLLQEDIDTVTRLIEQGNQEFPDVQTAMAWARNVRDLGFQLNDPSVLDGNRQLQETWQRVITSMFAQEAQLAQLDAQIVIGEGVASRLANAQVGAQMARDVLDGWVELERLGVQIPRELRDEMFEGVAKLQSPREWGRFMKYYYSYQRFFKTYAISTPGFIVRNSMTSAFNNMVAGVRATDQRNAIKFAVDYYKNGLDAALNNVPAGQRARYEQAFEAVTRAGGGQAIDELIPMVKGKGSGLYNNRYTRFFQRANEASEIAARMGLALDATTRGLSIEENAARIARYHFDYSDISQLDAVAKAFIPFWTFASRNVQLQFVNRLARPNMYNRWEDVQKLGPEADDENWPIYLRERGAIPLSATQYIAPDLPQIDMVQQARRLADPVLLTSQANPLIRALVETISQRSTAFDYPYSQSQQPLGVTDWPSAFAGEALDVFSFGRSNVSRPLSGTATSFVRDLAPSIVPPLQQFQRYAQAGASALGASPETQQIIGGRPTYAQRDPLAALAAYLGVPYGTVTPEQIQGELRRRQFAIESVGRRAREGG